MLDRTHIDPNNAATTATSASGAGVGAASNNWSRSFQNPVGNVYYNPNEPPMNWPPSDSIPAQESPAAGPTPHATPPMFAFTQVINASMSLEKPGKFSFFQANPFSYQQGPYMFRQDQSRFYDSRPQKSGPVGLGAFLPKPAASNKFSLGTFLPMPENANISPRSLRREGGGSSIKSQRPYSADVNRLFSVEEHGSEKTGSSQGSSFKKGNLFLIFFQKQPVVKENLCLGIVGLDGRNHPGFLVVQSLESLLQILFWNHCVLLLIWIVIHQNEAKMEKNFNFLQCMFNLWFTFFVLR